MSNTSFKSRVMPPLYVVIVLICLVGIFTTDRERAPYVIKFATQSSTYDEDYIGLVALKEYVERESEGQVEIQIFPSGQFCSNVPECIGNLQKGVLEGFSTTVGGTGNFFPPAQVLDLPYVFSDDEHAECVLAGPILGEMREQVLHQGLNLRLMGVTNTGGWRNFATVSKSIQHPDDLKGQKIRTTPAIVQQELVTMLGANPTPVAWSELYTALATGVVEGSKNGIQDIINAKLHEHIKFMVLDGHSYMAAFWWFSEPVWQSLPEDIQAILQQGFILQQAAARNSVSTREASSYQAFEQAGGVIHTPTELQKEAFKASSSGMREWFRETYGERWLNLLETSVTQCASTGN